MSHVLGTTRALMSCLAVAALGAHFAASAQDKAPPPPYQNADADFILIGVAWDEAAVSKVLPPNVKPVPGATGGINIYTVGKGFGIAPYSSAYFWVDVEGYDSVDGTKGRWMLTGVYGPNEKTTAAMRDGSFFPVRNGTAKVEATAQGRRATGMIGDKPIVVGEIRLADEPCSVLAGQVNYPVLSSSKQVMINVIPYVGEACKSEPVSVDVVAPAGDAFAAFKPVKLLWALELKNASMSFHSPIVAK